MDLYEHGHMDVQTRQKADSELTKHYPTFSGKHSGVIDTNL